MAGLVRSDEVRQNFYDALNQYSDAMSQRGWSASDFNKNSYAYGSPLINQKYYENSGNRFSLSGGTDNLYNDTRAANAY